MQILLNLSNKICTFFYIFNSKFSDNLTISRANLGFSPLQPNLEKGAFYIMWGALKLFWRVDCFYLTYKMCLSRAPPFRILKWLGMSNDWNIIINVMRASEAMASLMFCAMI